MYPQTLYPMSKNQTQFQSHHKELNNLHVILNYQEAKKQKKLSIIGLLMAQECRRCTTQPKERWDPFCTDCSLSGEISRSTELREVLEAKEKHSTALHKLLAYVRAHLQDASTDDRDGLTILFGRTCGACAAPKSVVHSMCKPCYKIAAGSNEFENVEVECDALFDKLEALFSRFNTPT